MDALLAHKIPRTFELHGAVFHSLGSMGSVSICGLPERFTSTLTAGSEGYSCVSGERPVGRRDQQGRSGACAKFDPLTQSGGLSMSGTIGVLQARMTSTRFPGKVLADLQGQPMIARQLERLARSVQLEGLVVATSVDSSDDKLADFVGSLGVEVFRGDLSDVLARFIGVAHSLKPDVIVRLTADCPLASPAIIDRVISEFRANDVDYASNTLNPTFPDGIDVEVVKTSALEWIFKNSSDPHEREHVTLGVYRRPEDFKLLSVRDSVDHSDLRWTVDEEADLDFVRWVYSELYEANTQFEYQDILELIARNPAKSRTSADAVRNAALAGLDTGAMDV